MTTKYTYYQTDAKLVLTIYEKNLEENEVKVHVEPKKLRVTYKDKTLFNSSLLEDVVVDETTTVVKKNNIEIVLKKVTPKQWATIEDKEKDKQDAKAAPTDKWTAIAREADEDEEKEGGVDKFFKTIFKDADDDTKRAIMKSYTESKGTVLSTNWKEISEKKTPIKPPEGLEFKEYPH
uniref:SGS domain-containing protein n=1 Tax=Panagrellus redivivus TaxID=6233 RepID=A0A7E4VKH5_PANRE